MDKFLIVFHLVRFVPQNIIWVGTNRVRMFRPTSPTWSVYQPTWASMQISHLCKRHHGLKTLSIQTKQST